MRHLWALTVAVALSGCIPGEQYRPEPTFDTHPSTVQPPYQQPPASAIPPPPRPASPQRTD
jgi:hypothetical protein